MATITWNTLTASKTTLGSIANWVNRSDLPTDFILEETEAWIYQRLRSREMMAYDETFQLPQGESKLALPEGFLDPIELRPWGWYRYLPYVYESKLDQHRTKDGTIQSDTPTRWTIIGEEIHFSCVARENFGMGFTYYKQPEPLSSSNPTNFMTKRYPTLLRHACMSMAFQHMKDTERATGMLKIAMGNLSEAAQTNDMFRRSQLLPMD